MPSEQTVIVPSPLHVWPAVEHGGIHAETSAATGDVVRSAQLAFKTVDWQLDDRTIAENTAWQLSTVAPHAVTLLQSCIAKPLPAAVEPPELVPGALLLHPRPTTAHTTPRIDRIASRYARLGAGSTVQAGGCQSSMSFPSGSTT